MVSNLCASPGPSWGTLRQSSIGFKKNSELNADEEREQDLINAVRIAKSKLAVVKAKIAAPVARVVVRLSDVEKVARERAFAEARQQKRRALKKAAKPPNCSQD